MQNNYDNYHNYYVKIIIIIDTDLMSNPVYMDERFEKAPGGIVKINTGKNL